MKKIIIFILTFSFCSIPYKQKNAISYLKVTAQSGLILRNGPGQNFSKIKTLPKGIIAPIYEYIGDNIEIKGYKGKWILTQFEDQFGYVFSGHVFISSDKDSFSNDYIRKIPLTQFLATESGKPHIIKKLNERNRNFLEGNEKVYSKKIIETDLSIIETISFGEIYYPKTFFRTNKESKIIEYPDVNNFHPGKLFEAGKIIEGEEFICYGCCAMPIPIMAILGNTKSYTFYGSVRDTVAMCYPEAGNIDYNMIRYSDTKNQLFIHTKSGDCNEKLLISCYESNKTDSCSPKKYLYESFKIINNPFDEPMLEVYVNSGIPEKYLDEFKKSRKLKELEIK